MTIETLTERERRDLVELGARPECAKAVAIIDQLTTAHQDDLSELERLSKECEQSRERALELQRQLHRSQRFQKDTEEECARLQGVNRELNTIIDKKEVECTQLKAQDERHYHHWQLTVRALANVNRLLAQLGVWADNYGSALIPSGAADTFGDGVRHCKQQVKEILSSVAEATPTLREDK